MKLNLKAGESIRIANDHGTGFTFWTQEGLLHVTANPAEKQETAPKWQINIPPVKT